MKYVRFSLIFLIWTSLSFSSLVRAQQPWSGILTQSRAVDWSHAGLPATLPDGETTPNPWTPPIRSQCGATLSASATVHDINVALASCRPGTYVQLAGTIASPVTYNINASSSCYAGSDTCIQMYNTNGVTLRGGGPQATTIHLSGYAAVIFGVTWNKSSVAIASGLSQGSTSITVPSINAGSGNLVVGELAYFNQCDTGFSGNPCSGSSADNGSIYVCGDNTACQIGSNSGPQQHQVQLVRVTGISGSGPYAVTFTPALRLSNWSTSRTASLVWQSSTGGGGTAEPYGNGLEDMTIYETSPNENQSVEFSRTYASWVKGVRFIGAGVYVSLHINGAMNALVMNNYFFADPQIDSLYPPPVQESGSSDNLILNNISASGVPWEGMGGNSGDVYAYNYNRDTFTGYVENVPFDHAAYSSFDLFEGNQTAGFADDDTWGTHGFNTFFRNYLSCWDPPYVKANARGLVIDNYHRFDNAIGNSIGTAGICTTYQSADNYTIFRIGSGDALAGATLMRWGNASPVAQADDSPANSGIRFSPSEVPANLASPNAAFSIPVPSSTSLPASFYMSIAAHPNGGTGLSWWKVCTNWSSFPTSCAATVTKPFPIAGPDVTSGSYVNGHAYDIPAQAAWKNLPVDASFQRTYTITGSSWSGGVETLSISGLPDPTHLMGGFQLSGTSSACNPSGGEQLITGSSGTTVSYALASNPGVSCTGTFKFPDIRQFDERVYQADSGQVSASQPGAPSGLVGSVGAVQ